LIGAIAQLLLIVVESVAVVGGDKVLATLDGVRLLRPMRRLKPMNGINAPQRPDCFDARAYDRASLRKQSVEHASFIVPHAKGINPAVTRSHRVTGHEARKVKQDGVRFIGR